jgi:hypothetical protein
MNSNKEYSLSLIDTSKVEEIKEYYPEEFNEFCTLHKIFPPKINTNNGKALSVMLHHPNNYWNRETSFEFCRKFGIETKDSIQLFNKHSQWGISTSSGIHRGKYYIEYPYKTSNKHKMRKNFKYNGTVEEKYMEIEKIKSTIKHDYVDVPNDKWQLGHKNPGSIDNSITNQVLQPPIQPKYRDDFIFIDTLTKIPLPLKMKKMLQKGEIVFTNQQIQDYLEIFNNLLADPDSESYSLHIE